MSRAAVTGILCGTVLYVMCGSAQSVPAESMRVGSAAKPVPEAMPKFFVENNITEVRYAYVAMHVSEPEMITILKTDRFDDRQKELLAKADCGSWKKFYEDDRICDGMKTIVEFVSGDKVVKRVDFFNIRTDGLKHLLDAARISRTRKRKYPRDIDD